MVDVAVFVWGSSTVCGSPSIISIARGWCCRRFHGLHGHDRSAPVTAFPVAGGLAEATAERSLTAGMTKWNLDLVIALTVVLHSLTFRSFG